VKEVDLLYHESTFCEDKKARAKQTMHSTAAQAATVAKEAAAKHLLIGHYSARYADKSKFEEEAKAVFPMYSQHASYTNTGLNTVELK